MGMYPYVPQYHHGDGGGPGQQEYWLRVSSLAWVLELSLAYPTLFEFCLRLSLFLNYFMWLNHLISLPDKPSQGKGLPFISSVVLSRKVGTQWTIVNISSRYLFVAFCSFLIYLRWLLTGFSNPISSTISCLPFLKLSFHTAHPCLPTPSTCNAYHFPFSSSQKASLWAFSWPLDRINFTFDTLFITLLWHFT